MTTTSNLAITLIETSQSQKEVTTNAALTDLDAAITETTEISCNSTAESVTAAQMQAAVRFVLTAGSPAPGGTVTVTLAAVKRLLMITNDCGEDAEIECDGGSLSVSIADGASSVVYCDGSEVYGMSGGTSSAQTESIIIACSDETTSLATGTAKVTFRMPYAFTLSAVRASVTTAPTGAALSIGINEAGSSILSTDLTIDASEKTSATAATAAVISDTALADDAEITIDIDQVGSTIAGAGLKVMLIGTKA